MTASIDGISGAQSTRPVVVEVQRPDLQSSTTAGAQDVSSAAAAPASPEQLADAVRKVEQLVQTVRRSLQFRDDPASGRMVVSVIDADSGEVIRQIPPEQMLRMAANLEQLSGLLLGERA